jgi:hypothetical protein
MHNTSTSFEEGFLSTSNVDSPVVVSRYWAFEEEVLISRARSFIGFLSWVHVKKWTFL